MLVRSPSLLGLALLCACASELPRHQGTERDTSRTERDEALDASVDAPGSEPLDAAPAVPPASDAATGDAHVAPHDPHDPTAPGELTGVYRPPSLAQQRELQALLDHERSTLLPLECPDLLAAASCGDGRCDPLSESEQSCRADCVPHLVGAYNDLPICPDYRRLLQPTSVQEVQDALAQARARGERVHPIGRRHSASDALCGDGVALDMSAFADVEATRLERDVAYVQPGVTMIALGDWLDARGLSIGYAHLGFRGVTVAGAIGTAAHGSSPVHANTLASRVVSLQLVLADGTLRTLREGETDPTLWRALTTSLGLLGVVVELGLRVEPALRLDVELTLHDEAELLASDPMQLLAGCDWAQLNWFPRHRQFFRWCGKQTDAAPDPGANNVLLDPGVPPDVAPLAKLAFHAGTCGAALNELMEAARFDGLVQSPPIVIDGAGGPQHVRRAVGPAHRMTSADLIELGQNKYFQMDWEVAVPQQYMRDALQAARAVFDAHDVSLPGVGAFLRFGKIERGGWLSYHSAGKEFAEGQTALFFETPVAIPAGYTEAQLDDYLHVYRGLISLFVRHYGARAHWGKNLDAVFELQREVGTYQGRLEAFNRAVAELDPTGLFSNAFAERIGVRWPAR